MAQLKSTNITGNLAVSGTIVANNVMNSEGSLFATEDYVDDSAYVLPSATTSTLGGVKVGSNITVSGGTISLTKTNVTTALGYTPPSTTYTHPTYTARTGKPTANATPAFGGKVTVSQITSNSLGHVTAATDRTITIPATLSSGTGTAGLIKTTSTVTSSSGYTACPVIGGVPYYKDTNSDTKVTQTLTTSNSAYPILLAPAGQTATKTTGAYFDSGVTINPSTNTITASKFSGSSASLSGSWPLAISQNGQQYAYFRAPTITANVTYDFPAASGTVLLKETVASATLSSATTTNKTIVGAINELNSAMGDVSSALTSIISQTEAIIGG